MRASFARNLIRMVRPSFVDQVERNLCQFRASTSLINPTFSQSPATTTTFIKRDFCLETGIKKKKQKKNPPAVDHVGRLDLRIGTVVEAVKAPDADTLYLTKVDIGGEFRSIVAGFAKFVTVEELLGKNVVVLCNIKASKLRGHLSEGMIMCAKIADILEPLEPPANARAGDLVCCHSYDRVLPDNERHKNKLYDPLAADMQTDDELIACYKGSSLYVPEKGNITTKSLKNAPIT